VEILDHLVGDNAFLPRGARHAYELEKELGDLWQPVPHRPILESRYRRDPPGSGSQAGFRRTPGPSPDVLQVGIASDASAEAF
jgi:hypothetical protein